jgi:molecular chaperone DnaK (HSP70)
MAGAETNGAPGDRVAIGISFGNSNSSIAFTTVEDKAEVIANEEGGMYRCPYQFTMLLDTR